MRNWREKALVVGIAILFAAFIALAIDAFYPRPGYGTEAYHVWSRNVFILDAIVGTLAIITGSILVPPPAEALGSGLMWGGIFTLLFGTAQYFEEMGKVLRVIVVGIALAVLIWIGLKKLISQKQ